MRIYLIAPDPETYFDPTAEHTTLGTSARFTYGAAAGIATVASWFPEDMEITLCDEAVEDVDLYADVEVVGLSINVAQLERGLFLAEHFLKQGKCVIVGGAHVSLAPEMFRGKATSLVIGEFETVAESFTQDLRNGTLKAEYHCDKADLSRSRTPRWDLYPNHKAIAGIVQTSRGCPFECTFCDVIQYVGRKQRHKPPALVVEELQTLYELGYREIILSDDNFTVYRKRTHELLDEIIAWNGTSQRDNVRFSTQLSIDLAKDPALLKKCNQAGLRNAFIGLETSNQDSLSEVLKRQNLRIDPVSECSKIVAAGLTIHAGLIVGFDHDDASCFEQQLEFAQSLPIVGFNVSALVAPHSTPFYKEMESLGRIVDVYNENNLIVGGRLTNIIPAQMTRNELAEGREWLKRQLLEPERVIQRFEHYASILGNPETTMQKSTWANIKSGRRHPLFEMIPIAQKNKLVRRVIDCVRNLSTQRPEISYDLTSVLTIYLSSYVKLLKSDASD